MYLNIINSHKNFIISDDKAKIVNSGLAALNVFSLKGGNTIKPFKLVVMFHYSGSAGIPAVI